MGSYKYLKEKKKYKWKIEEKKNVVATIATVPLEQTKNIITFTHSLNKYHNIFTKHLFLVVVGHSFIFLLFYFDL